MTLEQLKKDLVDDKKIYTEKQFKRFITHTSLFVGLAGFDVAYACYRITHSMLITIITLSITLGEFIAVTNYCTESEDNTKKINKLNKLWFIWVIILIVLKILLDSLRFK